MNTKIQIDYQELGFKCGLEVHQQIGTHKLFCRCSSIKVEGPSDYQIKRRLRGVVGETGEMDIAAKFETEKGKYFLYEGHSANTCLVELDETPPYLINKEALEIAFKIALLLNAKIVDEIQVMRKTVVDGSNTTGFQRTALIALNGYIETSKGMVKIPTICLEEEAAQKIEETQEYVRYNIDRLGITLVEIATDASIKDLEHAKEVASYIGMTLRSVEGVKRGLGTIRQDVNISIKDGARTEIKGFQDLRGIPKAIEYEINRQIKLVKEDKKLNAEVRKVEPDFTTTFLRPMPGAARLYVETDVLPVRIDKNYIKKLKNELPKLLTGKIEDFEKKYSIPKGLGEELIEDKNFEKLIQRFENEDGWIIIRTLINTPKQIKDKLTYGDFEEILSFYYQGKIAKEAIMDLLEKKSMGQKIDLKHYEAISDEQLENEIKKIIKEKPNLNISAYMGLIMAKHRGKIDGKKVMEILKKLV